MLTTRFRVWSFQIPWMEEDSFFSHSRPPLGETALQCGQIVWFGFDLRRAAAQRTCVFDSRSLKLPILCKIRWHYFLSRPFGSLYIPARGSVFEDKSLMEQREWQNTRSSANDFRTVDVNIRINKNHFIKLSSMSKQALGPAVWQPFCCCRYILGCFFKLPWAGAEGKFCRPLGWTEGACHAERMIK